MTDADPRRRSYQPGEHPGAFWRELMQSHDVTQAQMARATGTSAKHINQILQGNSLPSADLVLRMARAIHVDERDAFNTARLLFGLQGQYLIGKARTELKDWELLDDGWHTGGETHE